MCVRQAHRCSSVHGHNKRCYSGLVLKCSELVDEVAGGAAEPVKPPQDERVRKSKLIQWLVGIGPQATGSRNSVDEHPVAPGGLERVDMWRVVLVSR